jgi:DNA (cytosine-5)-methyltransferase 1
LKFKAGALFVGIGGFCEGFRKSGIETAWAIDNDERVEKTYSMNHPAGRFIRADVTEIKACKANQTLLEPVDVLHAGFPCQSFSMAGQKKGFNDPRGRLFFELTRIIEEFGNSKPPVLVFENSPFLQIGERGEWFKRVRTEIQKLGYWFKDNNAILLDPQEHLGVPQNRPRLFMIALNRKYFRSGRFTVELTSTPNIPLSDFINFEGEESDEYYLDEENRYFGMIDAMRRNEVETLYQLRKFRVRVKDHCPTLTANMGLGGHNVPFLFDKKGLRKLTERECLRLQGFSDFRFPEDISLGAKYLQIGNSVHVDIAHLVGKSVREKLETINE